MKVEQAMTRDIVCFKTNDTLHKVIDMFSKHPGYSGFPVVDSKRNVVGIISQSDIVRLIDVHSRINRTESWLLPVVLSVIQNGKQLDAVKKGLEHIKKVKIKDFMTKKVVTIDFGEDIYMAAQLINKHNITRIPVVKNKKLVGIITRGDVIKALKIAE